MVMFHSYISLTEGTVFSYSRASVGPLPLDEWGLKYMEVISMYGTSSSRRNAFSVKLYNVGKITINHPPVITINIYIYRRHVYHSQSWVVYDMVLAITMISPCSQPQGLGLGSPGASTQNIPHETSKTSRAQAAESTGTFRRRDKKCRKFMEVQQETGSSTSKW